MLALLSVFVFNVSFANAQSQQNPHNCFVNSQGTLKADSFEQTEFNCAAMAVKMCTVEMVKNKTQITYTYTTEVTAPNGKKAVEDFSQTIACASDFCITGPSAQFPYEVITPTRKQEIRRRIAARFNLSEDTPVDAKRLEDRVNEEILTIRRAEKARAVIHGSSANSSLKIQPVATGLTPFSPTASDSEKDKGFNLKNGATGKCEKQAKQTGSDYFLFVSATTGPGYFLYRNLKAQSANQGQPRGQKPASFAK